MVGCPGEHLASYHCLLAAEKLLGARSRDLQQLFRQRETDQEGERVFLRHCGGLWVGGAGSWSSRLRPKGCLSSQESWL